MPSARLGLRVDQRAEHQRLEVAEPVDPDVEPAGEAVAVDQLAVEEQLHAARAEGEHQVGVGARLHRALDEGAAGQALEADRDQAVLDRRADVPAGALAGRVLGEQALARAHVVGVEPELDRAVGEQQGLARRHAARRSPPRRASPAARGGAAICVDAGGVRVHAVALVEGGNVERCCRGRA